MLPPLDERWCLSRGPGRRCLGLSVVSRMKPAGTVRAIGGVATDAGAATTTTTSSSSVLGYLAIQSGRTFGASDEHEDGRLAGCSEDRPMKCARDGDNDELLFR